MCDHGCKAGVDCAHDREQDTWLSSTLRPRPATETHDQPEPVHGPALTAHGFTEALRLTRDGGEHV